MAVSVILVATPAFAAQPTIPKPFWGRWNSTLTKCDFGPPLEEVRIDRRRSSFWEWTHDPITVQPLSRDTVRIRAWLYESESDDPNKPSGKLTIILKLLAGGQRLSYQIDGDRPTVYLRCQGERLDQNW